MTCEGEVAAVVSWHCHDSSGAITHQDVICHPDRYLSSCERIDAVGSCEHARHFLHLCHTLAFGTVLSPSDVFFHSLALLLADDAADDLMFWCQHHEGSTEQSVGASGEDFYVNIFVGDVEMQ